MDPERVNGDPTETVPGHHSVAFENERVRAFRYRDSPGARTHPHHHPDSVLVTLTDFDRQLTVGDRVMRVEKPFGESSRLPAQNHIGEYIGQTETRVIFVELK